MTWRCRFCAALIRYFPRLRQWRHHGESQHPASPAVIVTVLNG